MTDDDDKVEGGDVSEEDLLEVNEADAEEAEDEVEGTGLNAFGDPIEE